MKRFTLPAIAILTSLVLAACTVTVEPPPGPPANTIDVTANNNPATPIFGFNLAAGATQVFRVSVPGSVAGSDLVYIELDRNFQLEVLNANYSAVIYSATSSASFSGSTGAAASTAGSLTRQSVATPVTCRGSCVITETAPSTFYVRVRNNGGVTASGMSLYVYGDDYSDLTEEANDATATAPSLVGFDGGAIETVGDIDYWFVTSNGNVAFDLTQGSIPLEAEVLDAGGNPIPNSGGPFQGGSEFEVFSGEYIRVWAVNSSQAAASSNSGYFLEYVTPLGGQGESRRR